MPVVEAEGWRHMGQQRAGDRGEPGDYLAQVVIETPIGLWPLGAPAPGAAARSLAAEAMRWRAVLRGRERWGDDPAIRQRHDRDALATLQGFGLDEDALRRMARAGRVVVRLPFRHEAQGWEGRIFPWEFVLARATRAWRRADAPLAVMRQLGLPMPRAQRPRPEPRVLMVRGWQPGPAAAVARDARVHRLREALRLDRGDPGWRVLDNPDLALLRDTCRRWQPDLVHVSGLDSHQGLARWAAERGPRAGVWYRGRREPVSALLQAPGRLPDGLLLRGDRGQPALVPAGLLGPALAAGAEPPLLVGLELWNGAARLAPLLLPAGAWAAAAFQDSFDEALGTYFFENLYDQLSWLDWDLPQAFEGAWAELRHQADLAPGAAIALWARAPLLPPQAAPASPARPPRPPLPAGEPVTLIVQPPEELSYAELHNRQPLFPRFEVLQADTAAPGRLQVSVVLEGGDEPLCFEAEFPLQGHKRLNLADRIVLPLAAPWLRRVSEALAGTLLLRVTVGGRLLRADTWPLRLLPVDQWRDNARGGRWLPAFVLPRDAAVEAAAAAARRALQVLRDDPAAGFDGYQGLAQADPAPDGPVDRQAEAIWATLLHDWQPGYISPPPSYGMGAQGQRLRTPTMLRQAGQGTCLDLALLVAACLELVDLQPVIFLLHGHALPGYWRHPEFREAFLRGQPVPGRAASARPDGAAATAGSIGQAPWISADPAGLAARLEAGQLVPLESVQLTSRGGFRQAIVLGLQALADAARFDAMVDIASARAHGVTPLPILQPGR